MKLKEKQEENTEVDSKLSSGYTVFSFMAKLHKIKRQWTVLCDFEIPFQERREKAEME